MTRRPGPRLGKRDLSGWTHTGGSGCSGREVSPLAGGGVDWSRPRCEPDNRLHVQLGRAAAVFVPLLAGLPVFWFGLVLNQRLIRSGFPAWVASQDWHAVWHYLLWGAGLAAATVLGGYLSRVLFAPAPGSARVEVTVASSRPPGPAQPYPAGQLVYRRFNSPALLQPHGDVPAPLAALPSPDDQGQWSA